MAESSGAVVLSFHDCLLRESDVELLDGQCWLNDKIIEFAFEYFERVKYAQFAEKVCFISPSVSQYVRMADGEEAAIFLEPLSLSAKELVFLVVNDNSDVSTSGGSHWSLLVYDRGSHEAQHFDSVSGLNSDIARGLTLKVEPFLKDCSKLSFREMDCPTQKNSNDCGVYVIGNAEHLCDQRLHGNPSSLETVVNPENVLKKRKELKNLILSLSKANT